MRQTGFIRYTIVGVLFGATAFLFLAGPAQAQQAEACEFSENGDGTPVQPLSEGFQENFCAEDDGGDDGDDGNGGDTTTTTTTTATTTTTSGQTTTTVSASSASSTQTAELPATGYNDGLIRLGVSGGAMVALGLGLRRLAAAGIG